MAQEEIRTAQEDIRTAQVHDPGKPKPTTEEAAPREGEAGCGTGIPAPCQGGPLPAGTFMGGRTGCVGDRETEEPHPDHTCHRGGYLLTQSLDTGASREAEGSGGAAAQSRLRAGT